MRLGISLSVLSIGSSSGIGLLMGFCNEWVFKKDNLFLICPEPYKCIILCLVWVLQTILGHQGVLW